MVYTPLLCLHPSPAVAVLSPGHSGCALRGWSCASGLPSVWGVFPPRLSTWLIPSAPSSQCLFLPEVFSDHSFYYFLTEPRCLVRGILVPWPEIEPEPPLQWKQLELGSGFALTSNCVTLTKCSPSLASIPHLLNTDNGPSSVCSMGLGQIDGEYGNAL